MIPFSLPRTFGTMVGNAKQGYAILAAMVVLWTGALVSAIAIENAHPGRRPAGRGRGDRGQGGPVRDTAVGDVRGVHHDDVHRRGRLDAFLLHRV